MDARWVRAGVLLAVVCSLGANYRTRNFIISAPTGTLAQEVGEAAEHYRRQLALEWLGDELPPWPQPCPVHVTVGPHLGAGGATSFMFDGGRPFGWQMSIQGSRERILDSVLPHEVTHTIFATHFGRPLPRWADEGACTTVEHISERAKQHQFLLTFLTTGRGIAFNQLFAMKEYPADVLPLYAQGYSLARFLIAQGGKRKFIDYIGDGMQANDWTAATRKHYGFRDLSELQLTWVDWVRRGSPADIPSRTAIAAAGPVSEQAAGGVNRLAADQRANPNADGQPDQPPQGESPVAPASGWYARVRDEAASRLAAHPSPLPKSTAPFSGRHSREAVSRPQPPAGPGQVVLPPSVPRRGSSSLTQPVPLPNRPILDATARPLDTRRR